MLGRRQRKAASWRPAAAVARPASGPRRTGGSMGFDLSRIPAQAPGGGLIGGSRKRPPAAKDEDLLPAIGGGGGGPRAVGAPEYYEVDGSTPTPQTLLLTTAEVSPPTGGDCSAMDWRIFWKLTQYAPTGGAIVQKVVYSQDSERCPTVAGGAPPGISKGSLTYWEAWPVSKGKAITAQAEAGAPHDDHLRRTPTPTQQQSRGMARFTTEARYYDGIDVAKLGFVVTGGPPAFDLPMTMTDPQLGGGSNAVARTMTARWDCCATGRGASRTTRLEVS